MEIESPNHSDTSSRRSPEFEFWMVNNHPELEQLDLHTADELFVDGVILPLHLLSISHHPHHHPHKSNNNYSKQKENVTAIHPEASILSTSSAPSTASKRWKDMFRKKECPPVDEKIDKKKEKRASKDGGGETTAQLNIINIWPFSRSRSAGTAAAGQKKPAAVAARKSSSAPCSRSNSRGESTGRWAASPGRPGIYVGRASPVWQARRKGPSFGSGFGPGPARPREKGRRGGGGGGVKGLNLNVNSCIGGGYRRCVEEEEVERVGGSLFRFRGLFSKKVY